MKVMRLELMELIRCAQSISIGHIDTEFSVTLSYLPGRINTRTGMLEINLLFQDFSKSGIVKLDVRA
jgi:hypothetical protein